MEGPQKIKQNCDMIQQFHQKKLKAGTPRDSYILTFTASIIHNGQKVETTQVPTEEWMNKHNVVHPYNGRLFSLKKKGDFDTYYNMNLEDSGINQTQKNNYCMIPFIWGP